jgi:TIR domain/WD40-like Beta Propeller Repeat
MTGVRVFISYRRGDSSGYAGRLYDRLSANFGEDRVFMDIDTIEPGVDFVQVINEALDKCDVFLAVIGPSWEKLTGPDGRRRLDDPHDFVRAEISAALERDILVIPVLVQKANMPPGEALPKQIERLAYRNAIELSDERWRYDVGRLTAAIESAAKSQGSTGEVKQQPDSSGPPLPTKAPIEKTTPERSKTAPVVNRRATQLRSRLAVAGVLAMALIGALLVWLPRAPNDDSSQQGGRLAAAGSDGSVSNGLIAFLSDQTGSLALWSMQPDGSHQNELYSDFTDFLRPDWSPDGKKLAFGAERNGDYDLWTMNADGSGLTQVTHGPGNDGAPDWSPDGRRLAFGSDRGGSRDIWILSMDSRKVTRITDDPSDDDAPDWSLQDRIAFESNRDGDHEIWTMDPNGDQLHQVTSNDAQDLFPDWSPDGDRIAYRSNLQGGFDIWVVSAEGGDPQRLTQTEGDDHRPAWAPDGKLIAFDSIVGGNTDILVISADGSNVQNLTPDPSNEESPTWQRVVQ